ncbi:MAG: biotin/lipoyl-binding protein [Oscillospiraceae bacterium]|jgi:biotin carboxyl carrier protein|nr:biotin/lipoyl-binding protein [Oscillospiraceae bacterium]
MKKYKVNVNGTVYEVAIEVMDGAAPVAAAPAAAAAPVAAAPAGGEKVSAPMPGTILDVKVSNGASVKKGDILFILEAMKMENEIMAPCDGTIASVSVTKGAAVDSGALLCVIG